MQVRWRWDLTSSSWMVPACTQISSWTAVSLCVWRDWVGKREKRGVIVYMPLREERASLDYRRADALINILAPMKFAINSQKAIYQMCSVTSMWGSKSSHMLSSSMFSPLRIFHTTCYGPSRRIYTCTGSYLEHCRGYSNSYLRPLRRLNIVSSMMIYMYNIKHVLYIGIQTHRCTCTSPWLNQAWSAWVFAVFLKTLMSS